ncbi:MAG: DUF108 domain-containing protein [Tissierellia bacterium]|nr:DUF108 domain-containing protein [Tissierellia bacterium]
MKNLAVIGYGALGKLLVSIIEDRLTQDYKLRGILDIALEGEAVQVGDRKIPLYPDFKALLEDDLDLVVEIAGVGALKDYGVDILRSGRDLVVTSVGSLADGDLLEALRKAAQEEGRKVHLTSGAIGGFDLLMTLKMMGGAQASIQSTKAPRSLNGAPYLEGKALPEDERVLAFSGNAKEAIQGFPKNTNVSVAAALATTGVEDLEVKIVSDPASQGNRHQVVVETAQAQAKIEVLAKPDKDNPKSSVTAAWSVAALLANLANPIQLF